ncbi:Sperm-associated antigen 7 [Liparis tanakae]|uniref:Sperm-associated antigen 7 n=1 Tax=Liparis tanakae TaxID=230148 RepID=A0A4Z2F9U1_9TELE|nr:Sperm-associated antigen 7 [Liparis tanakae]
MADLLGSILSSMEKPPTVGDKESRRKAREQAARLKKMEENERKRKGEFRRKLEKEVSDFIQDSLQQKRKYNPMGKIERTILHDVAEVAGLTSFSFGEEEESRYVMLFKKEQAALEETESSRTKKPETCPNSNYRDKYSHLIGTTAAKDAAHTLEANSTYGCVPVANKRDTRSIEEAMNEMRAKKRQKQEGDSGAPASSS